MAVIMIIDKIENACLYFGLSPEIKTALEFLQKTDCAKLEPGRHEIDGDKVYANVSRYDSKPREKGVWEAHRRYYDVQYVAAGTEMMGYANLKSLKVTKEYEEDGDYLLLEGKGDFVTASSGTFIIFGPEDAHMPGIAAEQPERISKVVVKVAV
jgi:YhcH/YjgK/YiaL family protein